MKKNKIFISLNDYSLPNATASYGVALAKKLERPAYLYGVEKVPIKTEPVAITGSGVPHPGMSGIGQVKKEAEKQLKKVYHEAYKLYPNVEYNVEIGFPETSLIDKTDEENPHLVVLEGNNELTTLHEWFGTYETRLAENIDMPVLVLPKETFWKPVERIVYIMELNDQKVNNMRFLTNLAKKLNSNIAVVLLSKERNNIEMDKYNQIVKTMRMLLEYDNVNFHQIFTTDSAETIDLLMTRVKADWLAFEHESHSFFERMFDNYNTKRLVLQSEIPVLVF